jgi:hypothetical protein
MFERHENIHDFGPIYAETDPSHFPVEPYNSFSNLIFLVIVILYFRRTGLSFAKFPLTVSSLPILFTGFVGGTIYHATRSHSLWLFLDFIPIAVLVFCAAVYFWKRLTSRLLLAILIGPLLLIVLRFILSQFELSRYVVISLSYSAMALTILLPAFIYAFRTHRGILPLLWGSLGFFVIAVIFRSLDSWPQVSALFPMGTHFLWHIFGGISTCLMMEAIYRDEQAFNRN